MRILLVCYGNICRSPMAEALMRRTIEGRPALRGIEVESVGVAALVGRAATEHTIGVLWAGYALDLVPHRARRLEPSVEADLILTLDRMTTTIVEGMGLSAEVVMLGDYVGSGEEVEDPYGREREAYCACAKHLARLVELAADRLESTVPLQAGQCV